jgi:uncharacterized membrane protein
MRPMRRMRWTRARRRLVAAVCALVGGILVVRLLPVSLWPLGIGLWLVWAGLGPVLVGGAMIWVGWRLWQGA